MVGVNEVGIRWKDNALIRGGLTDMTISCFYESHGGVPWTKCKKLTATSSSYIQLFVNQSDYGQSASDTHRRIRQPMIWLIYGLIHLIRALLWRCSQAPFLPRKVLFKNQNQFIFHEKINWFLSKNNLFFIAIATLQPYIRTRLSMPYHSKQ